MDLISISCDKIDESSTGDDQDFFVNKWKDNGSGREYNINYGFGIINCKRLIDNGVNWVSQSPAYHLPEQKVIKITREYSYGNEIPKKNETNNPTNLWNSNSRESHGQDSFDFSIFDDINTVENIRVTVSLNDVNSLYQTHHLCFLLKSPEIGNQQSVEFYGTNGESDTKEWDEGQYKDIYVRPGYNWAFKFESFRGVDPKGEWRLCIGDIKTDDDSIHKIIKCEIEIRGY